MTKYMRLIALAILPALLSGCGGNAAPESSPGPVSAEPQSLAEERESEALTEPTTEPTTEPETEPTTEPETEPRTVTLSERVKELELDIPEEYLEVIERETEIEGEVFAKMVEDEDKDPGEWYTIGYRIQDHLHVIYLEEHIWLTAAKNEAYVFDEERYVGVIRSHLPIVDTTIETYNDNIWMVLDVHSGNGSAFAEDTQIWYELSDPELPEVLSFKRYWMVGMFDPESAKTAPPGTYQVHGTDKYVRRREDGGEQYIVAAYWSKLLDDIESRITDPSNEILTASVESGVTRYLYDEEAHRFIAEEPPTVQNLPDSLSDLSNWPIE